MGRKNNRNRNQSRNQSRQPNTNNSKANEERQLKLKEEREAAEREKREQRILTNTFKLSQNFWRICKFQHTKNCSEKPDCLRCLGEETTQPKESKTKPDPTKRLRIQPYAGLRNLGSTCYMNCIVQCLFMNRNFRHAIYQFPVSAEENGEKFIQELQLLFCQLQCSKMISASPEALATILKIQTSVQQDVPEFNNLLLNYIDDIFKEHSSNMPRAVLQEFEGISLYQTKCSVCETVSSLEAPFLELEISMMDQTNILSCLESFLTPESLIGDNQYRCDKCDKLVDAKRRRLFKKLPPVLNFQLLRFVYDPETLSKKKSMQLFSFPKNLHLKKFCLKQDDEDFEYELSAVLLHVGESATFGHYIAHIRDEITNEWWEFDDTQVTKLDFSKVGDISSEMKSMWSNGLRKSQGSVSHPKKKSHTQFISSENAYFLVYTRVNRDIEKEVHPPPHSLQKVEESNQKLMSVIEQWRCTNDKEQALRLQHKEVYDEFMRLAPVRNQPIFHWISTAWLKDWVSGKIPTGVEIDNSSLLCPHEKVAPVIAQMKQISPAAWQFLHERHGGGPSLTKEDCCLQCAIKLSDELQAQEECRKFREKVQREARSKYTKPGALWISKQWLDSWCSSKDFFEYTDDINTLIMCQHDNLSPSAPKTSVSPQVWASLMQIFPCGTAFEYDVAPCSICQEEIISRKNELNQNKAERMHLRNSLPSLWKPLNADTLQPDDYFLIPQTWLTDWREFVTHPIIEKLRDIDTSEILCEHKKLGYDPLLKEPFVKGKKGHRLVQPVTKSDWSQLVEMFNAKQGIYMTVTENNGNKDFDYIPELCYECVPELYDCNLRVRAKELKCVWIHVPYSSSLAFFHRRQPGKDQLCRIEASPTDDVFFLKLKITQTVGIEPNQQELVYRDSVLQDNSYLIDSLVVDEAIIKLNIVKESTQKNNTSTGTPTISQTHQSDNTKKPSKPKQDIEHGFKGSLLTATNEEKKENEEKEEEEENSWICPVCTLENSKNLTICAVCETPAPLEGDGWVCSQCTRINEKEAISCDTCENPKVE